jgi:hypothetical protein
VKSFNFSNIIPPADKNLGGSMNLDQLARALELWRKNKTSTQERIPKHYWARAIVLAEQTSPTDVASKLKLDRGRLIKKMAKESFAHHKNKKIETGIRPKKKSSITFKKIQPGIHQNIPVFEVTTSAGTTVRIFQ